MIEKIEKRYYKYLFLSTTVLFVYMPFHIFFSQWLSTYTGGLDAWKIWKDFLTVLVTILFIVTVFLKKKQTKLYLYLLGLTVLYGLIHLVLLISSNRPTDIELLASAYNLRIFAYLIIGFSLALLVPKTNHLRRYSKILIFISTIVCIIALVQWILPKDIMSHFGYSIERGVKPNFFIDDKPDFPRVFSTLRDPNSLGAFLILPIVLIVQNLIKTWKTQKRSFVLSLLTLHVLILFLTFSRSTLLATIVAVSVLLGLQYRSVIKKHKKILAMAMVAGLVVLIGLFALLRDTYLVENLVLHSDESTTLADPNELRVSFFQKGIDGVADEPFGHGPGSAGLVSTRLDSGVVLTENYFLQIAYEVGVAGFIVFVALLYLIIKNLWDLRSNPLVVALLAGFAGLVCANMLFHTWANEAVAISWFFLAGLALAGKKSTKTA